MTTDELAVETRRLVDRVSTWTPPRWAASSASGPGTRADRFHALIQELADQAADAEGQPHRVVPRLSPDTALPDQLRVVVADLIEAARDDEARLTAATKRVLATKRAL
ncbi:hypothetical protein GCM10009557_54070 [Virgisporangium ochraceum]|uniref:Uncharacterized protein n=1 Tax=Virgisporangium ochraceum TaxID=65505 RepID=A0A8J3ZNG3_9ACTN|nr:hypothetical protein [Virgisporangium ochraceum]GIJ65220.1 hypothetical protein Voc01_001370 [Virgisporangium ochraceum]